MTAAKRKSVMVVDDDYDILSNIVQLLESEGYQAHQAENGKAALEKLIPLAPEQLPGCIVLDLMMPVMDGQSFLKTIESDYPQLARIPVVVTTAQQKSKVESEKFPRAVENIPKPFELDYFLKAIHKYCDK